MKMIISKYIHTEDVHNLKSPSIIVPYLVKTFNPASVIDIGCGIGTFLHCFKESGINKVLGVDGSWVNREQLFIDNSEFLEADLEKPLDLNRKFDLVLCLEVVEHLKESSADTIIKNLVSLGNTIIFSAAVPNQGGQNHLNEQNFSYWQEKFAKHGYSFYDIFREQFWNNTKIDWWYRQNMFLVAHDSVKFTSDIEMKKIIGEPLIFMHPGVLETRISHISNLSDQLQEMKNGNYSLGVYFTALWRKFLNILKNRQGSKTDL